MCPIIKEAVDIIKKYEGFKPYKYLCPSGKWTVGYGHQIKDNELFEDVISEEKAEELLLEDIKSNYNQLFKLIYNLNLNDNQIGALTSLYYNIGGNKFSNSSLFNSLKEGKISKVAESFSNFIYYHTPKDKIAIKSKGLERRRNEEKLLFLQPA